MSEANFTLRVCSPAGLALEEEVSSAAFQSQDGQVGLLPLHCNYTGVLGVGLLQYTEADSGELRKLVVENGVCRYAGDAFMILADALYLPEPESLAMFEREKGELLEFIQGSSYEDPEHKLAREQLACIEAIEEVLEV